VSGLEAFVAIVALVLAFSFWFHWYRDLIYVNRVVVRRECRTVLHIVLPGCMALLLCVLVTASAHNVRDSFFWIAYYLVLGAAWIGGLVLAMPILGFSVRDDVLERRNVAALWPAVGAVVGFTLCFAGANIGEGPGAQAVLVSAGAASITFVVFWFIFERFTWASEAITVDRDINTGIRAAGVVTGIGMICGAAASGDWHPETFLMEFITAVTPAWAVLSIAIAVEKIPRIKISRVGAALAAIVYVAASVVSGVWMIRR